LNIQYLIASGHTLESIFSIQQNNVPYCGWTLPQYRYWTSIVIKRLKQKRRDFISGLSNAIDGALSKKNRKKLQQELDKLDAE